MIKYTGNEEKNYFEDLILISHDLEKEKSKSSNVQNISKKQEETSKSAKENAKESMNNLKTQLNE